VGKAAVVVGGADGEGRVYRQGKLPESRRRFP